MPRLLILTQSELTRDPRARRAAVEGRRRGFDVVGLCVGVGDAIPLEGVRVIRIRGGQLGARLCSAGMMEVGRRNPVIRELRGVLRFARLSASTVRLARAARQLGRFDIVHANDLDTLPAAYAAARGTGARLVYDSHEIYADQETDPPRLFRRVALAVERATARRADAVLTVSDPIARELERTLGLKRPVIAWLNCPERSGSDPTFSGAGPLRAVYQGAMGPGRPLSDLLDAAAAAEDCELTLRVVGMDKAALAQEIARRGLQERIRLADPVSPDRLVEALLEFDVGVIINRPVTRNDELVFPNKLFEYLMAGLAVVVPSLPGLAPLVDEERIGLTFEPGRPDLLGRALTTLASDRPRLQEFRVRARALAVDRLNAESQRDQLALAWGM